MEGVWTPELFGTQSSALFVVAELETEHPERVLGCNLERGDVRDRVALVWGIHHCGAAFGLCADAGWGLAAAGTLNFSRNRR